MPTSSATAGWEGVGLAAGERLVATSGADPLAATCPGLMPADALTDSAGAGVGADMADVVAFACSAGSDAGVDLLDVDASEAPVGADVGVAFSSSSAIEQEHVHSFRSTDDRARSVNVSLDQVPDLIDGHAPGGGNAGSLVIRGLRLMSRVDPHRQTP